MYAKYEEHFNKIYQKSSLRYRTFPHHIQIVRQWAEKLCDLYPEADRRAVIIAALFHDLGHFVKNNGQDHSIYSEIEARKFLRKEKASPELIEKVAHAIRSHRNRDVPPDSLEAKILVFSDSASHLTAPDVYLYVAAGKSRQKDALEKLERDWRDLDLFPEEKKALRQLYESWKKLIKAFPEEYYGHIQAAEKT